MDNMKLKNEINAIITIASRDITKLMRDRARVLASLAFPIISINRSRDNFINRR